MTVKKNRREARTWVQAGIPLAMKKKCRVIEAQLSVFAVMEGATLSADACAMLYDAAMLLGQIRLMPAVDSRIVPPDEFALGKEAGQIVQAMPEEAEEEAYDG